MAVCFLRALSVLGWKITIISFDSLSKPYKMEPLVIILWRWETDGAQSQPGVSRALGEAVDFPPDSVHSLLTLGWNMSWRQIGYSFTL